MLRVGSSGEAVQTLQLKLKELGYFSGTGTGYYGSVTKAAVIAFQQANGLSADGIAGPNTRNKVFSNNAAAVPQQSTAAAIADVITSYSIHYTKLYDPSSRSCRARCRPADTAYPSEPNNIRDAGSGALLRNSGCIV